jgi:hypothetical protein
MRMKQFRAEVGRTPDCLPCQTGASNHHHSTACEKRFKLWHEEKDKKRRQEKGGGDQEQPRHISRRIQGKKRPEEVMDDNTAEKTARRDGGEMRGRDEEKDAEDIWNRQRKMNGRRITPPELDNKED